MARDDKDDFRIKPGRVRDQGTRVKTRSLPFIRRVENAVRKAGGSPDRIGGASGLAGTRKGNGGGRFNARGRGAKMVAAFSKNGGGWQRDSGGRFRSRRVVVKARVVKLNPQRELSGTKMRGTASKAVGAHLRYLERDGVTRDGGKGRSYSAHENEADGRAFVARGREDRHQFRFIVAPEDSTEMADLRGFTRDLMRQMEKDLGTQLDWIAVDHHNTGHPHTHIIVRGVTEDGKTLNIAGDYIAHGVRRRASELATLELGHQSEIDVARKLANEVAAERLTRLDAMLLGEQRDHGVIDLRPGDGASYLIRENRNLMIGRAKQLERFGLATEVEPGQWIASDRAETTLKELGERNDVIKTMHRALADHGLAEERGADQYVRHGERVDRKVVGRVLAKGLAGDEMGERVYLVVDGVDGRVHHMEFADPDHVDELRRGMIVEAAPALSGPRPADRNIAANAEEGTGLYQPSRHLERIRDSFEQQGKDRDTFVRFHVRRLEALRRAGHVERIDKDYWRVPSDIVARGQSYDLSQGGDGLRVRVLSTLDLERQISSDGATWLDRELVARDRLAVADSGFGREFVAAIERRSQSLVDMGHATRLPNGKVLAASDIIERLQRAEVTRVGRQMAAERGLTYAPSKPGEYVSGRLAGIANLASGRFAMIDSGLGFQLVPWQPVLDKRVGQHVTGIVRDGGIEWGFGRRRGLGL